jgi:hypothetical protein
MSPIGRHRFVEAHEVQAAPVAGRRAAWSGRHLVAVATEIAGLQWNHQLAGALLLHR